MKFNNKQIIYVVMNLTFSYDNNKNNAIKYMTLKEYRKNKLKKILCSQ